MAWKGFATAKPTSNRTDRLNRMLPRAMAFFLPVAFLTPATLGQSHETPPPSISWKPGPGQLVREGAFLRNRQGRLVQGEGAWVFVFDSDASGESEPPMLVLPCRRLREMQHALELQNRPLTFQATGQVFAYDGRNYFLPSFFTVAATERPPEPAPPPPTSADSRDPQAGDLLREMAAPPRRPLTAQRATIDAGAEPAAALREGLFIASRRGRLVRDGGRLLFSADNGPDPSAKSDPAFILLPCQNLESLERLAQRRGEKAIITMSGRIFAYEGRNYLLPTFFVEERDREGNLVPGQ